MIGDDIVGDVDGAITPHAVLDSNADVARWLRDAGG